MTSKAREELYQTANDNHVLLREVTSSGRIWKGHMDDGVYIERPGEGFYGDADRAKRQIRRYAEMRPHWAANRPPIAPAVVEVEKEVIREVPVEKVVRELVALPDEEAYEAGFNDGLMEGKKLAGTVPPPDWPQPFTPDPEAARGGEERPKEKDRLRIQIDDLTHDRDYWKEQTTAARQHVDTLVAKLKTRDAALVALREDLVAQMAKLEAVARIQEIESKSLQEQILGNVARTRRIVTNIDQHGEWQTHQANAGEFWGKHADKILGAINLQIDGTEVKEVQP